MRHPRCQTTNLRTPIMGRNRRRCYRVPLLPMVLAGSSGATIPVDGGSKLRAQEMTMKSHDHQKLFSPIQIGPITLSHRVVMAPLTRSRSLQPGDVPSYLMREYYTQRASDGGFIISEATSISITGRGWLGAPGLYSDEQVEGWKKITAAVHAKGGHMFSQLWHTGRSSHVETTGGKTPVSASVNPSYWKDDSHVVSTPSGWVKPSPHRALDIAEIPGIIEEYPQSR